MHGGLRLAQAALGWLSPSPLSFAWSTMVMYLMSTTMLKIQKMSDIAPRTSSLEGSLAKMLGNTYNGDVPAHQAS